MPIYESAEYDRDKLEGLCKRNTCIECGGRLEVFLDPNKHLAFLACTDWIRTHHDEGISRPASRWEREGMASLNIEARREIMKKAIGPERTRALAKYAEGGVITKDIATEIVETLWGDAPAMEKAKAVLLCHTYQLNPLMRHIYLVGYRKKDRSGKVLVDRSGKEVMDWSLQIGIGATRLMAQRKHSYSYLDMTPRKATQEEIDKILGDTADEKQIYGFVHIKDTKTGAEAFGLRGIGKGENIKGKEKGNTHLNLACIRAERLALDRQYPGEMPQGLEIMDERFVEPEPEVEITVETPSGTVIEETGEIIEGTLITPETPAPQTDEKAPETSAGDPAINWNEPVAPQVSTELWGMAEKRGKTPKEWGEALGQYCKDKGWGVKNLNELTKGQAAELFKAAEAGEIGAEKSEPAPAK